MRFVAIFGLIVPVAPAAIAQTSNADTYKAVIEHGIVIVTPDIGIDVTFMPDGKFTAMKALSSGTWKIVGDRMCSTPSETLIESCAVYPAGKKSGDTFELDAPGSRVTIRIR